MTELPFLSELNDKKCIIMCHIKNQISCNALKTKHCFNWKHWKYFSL